MMAAVVLALTACEVAAPVAPVPVPPARPDRPAARPEPAPLPTRLSVETAIYYARVQASFQVRGLMRTDAGGADAPFSTRDVVESFMQIAFYAEYADRGGRLVPVATASRMQRWERPVAIRVIAGPAVPAAQAAQDRANITGFAARLARVSGHPVAVTAGGGNFTVLILTEDERRAFGPRLNQIMPGLSPATVGVILNMAPSTYCLVVARAANGSNVYAQAVAVIRAEHPDLLRLSCIHEELAQGLGLANDSPRARPSIFNDDEEFALLTRLDEVLLKILYDPRLHPGMTETEARPIVEQIAEEIMGGPV